MPDAARKTHRIALLALAVVGAAAASLHCTAGSGREQFDRPVDDAGHVDPAPFEDASTVEPSGDCSEENKQIFVVSQFNKALYRFAPESLTFTKIGDIVCPTGADTESMAIDRKGNAWVEYQDGRMFLVSTTDASCKEIPFRNDLSGFRRFGMGFAKDLEHDSETLYVHGEALGKIDTTTYELSLVGSSGLGMAELTGTGTGLLYAFVVRTGKVVHLDKATGAVQEQYRTSAVDPQAAWAFAHWGGDFWLFTGTKSSSVTRYSPKTDTSTVVLPDTGMVIVGAGSSTCAPTEPPR